MLLTFDPERECPRVILAAWLSVLAVAPALAQAPPSPPMPTVPPTYVLSEGATGSFFDEDVLIANPNDATVSVTLTFSTEGGQQVVQQRSLPPRSRLTVHVDQVPGLENVATSVQVRPATAVPLIVERSMFWDNTYYAGHTGTAVDSPSLDWFFAEGSQGGFFDTYILVINPNPTPADVSFTFFREGEPATTKTVTVGASTRLTLFAGDVPEIVNRSFGIAVHATQPIMAERAMYFGSRPGRVWGGGTESAGVPAASTHWFLAEGATGSFFDTFILLSNPQSTPAQVQVKYLLDSGETITVPKTLAAGARLTTNVEAEADPRLRNAAFSTVVTSDVPVIAERSMFWPGVVLPWGEGHNSFGVVDAGTSWGLSEGRAGGTQNFHTFILLANPEPTAAEVNVAFLRESGSPVLKTYTVAPTSRFNIDANAIDGLQNASFGALIQVTNHVPIIVERSMYWDVGGLQFAAGTNATGIRLPDLTEVVEQPAQIRIISFVGPSSFTPNPAPIAAGRTVAWKNDDSQTHRIVADDGSFDTGNIDGGATSMAVTRPAGTVAYHCTIHPTMTGTITTP